MVADEDLTDKTARLLEVDNKLYLPIETNIRVLVTAADVLHC
jgi:cytochrome c oxidase subunit 2